MYFQVNPAGRIEILSASEDGVQCLQCVPEEESTAAAFHRGGHRQLAVGCRSGRMFIWDTKFKHIIKTFTNAPSAVKILDFNSKNKYLAAGLESGETVICNVMTNTQIGVIKVPFSNKVSALRFHPELRSVLALASDEGCILLRDLDNGKNRLFFKDAHNSVISDVEFSRINGNVMVSCGFDKKMHMYDLKMEQIVNTIETDSALTCVDVNDDGQVALGNKKGEVLIYDLRNFSAPVTLIGSGKWAINKVAFRPEVAKRKHYVTMDASLKEAFSPSLVTQPECASPESSRSFDFIEQFNSPSPLKDKTEVVNSSKDSFLVNIVGGLADSDKKNNSAPDFIAKRAMNFSKGAKSLQASQDSAEKGGTSQSTPIFARSIAVCRTISQQHSTPSPISRNIISENFEHNESSKYPPTTIKKMDSVDSISTVKCNTESMNELGNELKDFIKYSIYDVLEQSKNNFYQMTIQQTKNRLFLEDQISNLAHRVEDLQQTQNILIEENKKLSIEVEMLRSARF